MEKICHDWKHLLDKDFTNGKNWNDFAENAQNSRDGTRIRLSYPHCPETSAPAGSANHGHILRLYLLYFWRRGIFRKILSAGGSADF